MCILGVLSVQTERKVSHLSEAPEQIENTLVNGKDILHDDMKRMDIELESITGVQYGIWNSIESRLVFLEIISQPETSCGVLALGLDLICRNCDVYLKSIGANANSNRPRRNDLFYNEDIDEIINEHIAHGRKVKRLLI